MHCGKLFSLKRIKKLLDVSGSREAEDVRAGDRHAGHCRKLRDNRTEVLLIEVQRQDKYDDPDDDAREEAEPLIPPDSAQHAVIVLRERVYLFEMSFQFRIHMSYILAPHRKGRPRLLPWSPLIEVNRSGSFCNASCLSCAMKFFP